MNENISRLMDGELDDVEFERCCAELKADGAMQAWVCYHVIGDQLRGAHGALAGIRRALLPRRWRRSRRCSRRAPPNADALRSPPRSPGRWPRRSPRSPSSAGRRFRWSRCRRRAVAKAREADIGARGAGQAGRRLARRLPACAPGIFAGDGDPGRRVLPARRDGRHRPSLVPDVRSAADPMTRAFRGTPRRRHSAWPPGVWLLAGHAGRAGSRSRRGRSAMADARCAGRAHAQLHRHRRVPARGRASRRSGSRI